jgi:hypothetical protein
MGSWYSGQRQRGRCVSADKKFKKKCQPLCETSGTCYSIPKKRRLNLRIPFYRLLHRKVAQLVHGDDSFHCVERARGRVADELLIRSIDISRGVVAHSDAPVIRVVFPQDRLRAYPICDYTDTAL